MSDYGSRGAAFTAAGLTFSLTTLYLGTPAGQCGRALAGAELTCFRLDRYDSVFSTRKMVTAIAGGGRAGGRRICRRRGVEQNDHSG